ncbi:MAG: T9SS type A sorting domain-containing protein, partial [Bacteroidota bacterium]
IEEPLHEKGHYSIRYAEFVVPLVKAVQEQQEHIETLTQRIETLERLLGNTSQQQPENSDEENKVANSKGFVLYQNIPNPFDKTTTIKAELPQEVNQAKIIIYNLQGLELEQYPIAERGIVSVSISAGRFPSGMYIYALVADEKIIDTKKMILTK